MPVTAITNETIVELMRSRGISTSDLGDADILNLAGTCLYEYLFYRPKVSITAPAAALVTVANQPNYAKPTGALWIIDVCWNPSYSEETDDLWEEILLSTYDSSDPTLMLIDYQKMSRLHRTFNGHWKELNDQIWLMPAPSTAGDKVAVIYASMRTLADLDVVADFRFFDLCFYNCMLSVGEAKIASGGWKAGAYTVSESVGRETVRHANKKLEQTRLLLANSYVGTRS